MELAHRFASISDSDLVLAWRNDPWVRENSREISTISAETHASWFSARIKRCREEPIFIFSKNGLDIGFTRLDLIDHKKGKFEVSIVVEAKMRGKGYGFRMLEKTVEAARQLNNASEILGYVRKSNYSSVKLFENVGFSKLSTSKDYEKFVLILKLKTPD
jgi:UDP-2,4-diacetamido-2,4,6-trideoxy-beta-L-altropyranose hydrolase